MSIKHIGFDQAVPIPSIVFEIRCPKCKESFVIRVALMGIQVQCQLGTKMEQKVDVKMPGSHIPDFRPRTVA
jgi:hypothetical protein